MKHKFIIALLFISLNYSFSQEKVIKTNGNEIITVDREENGKVENEIYTCYKFDWKINIPEGFLITDISRIQELEKKGYSAVKNELPDDVKDLKKPTHLIGFGKDKRNNFSSNITSLKGTKRVTLEEHKQFVAKLMRDSFSNMKGLIFEQNESNIKIGKHNFYKIQDKIFHPKTNELVATLDLYSCYIGDYLFSVVINHNNEEDKKILTENFIKSLEK